MLQNLRSTQSWQYPKKYCIHEEHDFLWKTEEELHILVVWYAHHSSLFIHLNLVSKWQYQILYLKTRCSPLSRNPLGSKIDALWGCLCASALSNVDEWNLKIDFPCSKFTFPLKISLWPKFFLNSFIAICIHWDSSLWSWKDRGVPRLVANLLIEWSATN